MFDNTVTRRALLAGGAATSLLLFSEQAAQAATWPILTTRDGILHAGKPLTDRTVWLTFDDYGSSTQVKSILNTLHAYNVRAVFFPIGSFARYHPDLIRLMKSQGHRVGNHTYDHKDLTYLTNSRIKWEIDTAAHYIGPNTTPKLFRAPYGNLAFSSRLTTILKARGYQSCYWTVDTRDWSGSSAATIIRRVRYGDFYTPPVHARGVVLMHMHGRYTGQALPGVIKAVHARGLTMPRLY
jgi:peptidoglycan/xylan/chitin deacetylase (PgdA/CDA1 family)